MKQVIPVRRQPGVPAAVPYAIPMVIAGLLYSFRIDAKSLWLDEVLTLRIAGLPWEGMWQHLLTTEPYRWLYYLILSVWVRLGSGDAYYRMLSALFGMTAIPGIYYLGREIRSHRIGLLAAYALSMHPVAVRYAQEVHSYSLLLSLSVWSSYYFLSFLRNPSARPLIRYVVSALGAVYAHHFGVLLIPVQAIASVHTRVSRSARYLVAAGVLLAAGLVPLILFRIPPENIAWIGRITPDGIIREIVLLWGGHALLVCVGGFAVAIAVRSAVRDRSFSADPAMRYVCAWSALPFMTVVAVSMLYRPVFVDRYLIFVLPSWILLASIGLSLMPRAVRYVLAGVSCTLLLTGVANWHWTNTPFRNFGFYEFTDREEWREAAAYVHENDRADDAIVFYAYFVRFPFDYYYDQLTDGTRASVIELSSEPYPIGGSLPEPDLTRLRSPGYRTRRVWLVLSHHGSAALDRRRQSEAIRRELRGLYPSERVRDFTGVTVILFSDHEAR